jgi:hypothetical protein
MERQFRSLKTESTPSGGYSTFQNGTHDIVEYLMG